MSESLRANRYSATIHDVLWILNYLKEQSSATHRTRVMELKASYIACLELSLVVRNVHETK